tara:strand:- start:3238 stop:4590 length:1353 start_codon:yes stop_codon:yes gene_type:complete
MENKLRINLFQEKIRQMWENYNVKVRQNKRPLYEWITPHITTQDRLNWALWDNDVKLQEDGLKDLIESNGNSFFLWKKTQHKYLDDSDIRIITKEEATKYFLFDLMVQEYTPILCNHEESETKQRLINTEEDARKKIEDSIACYEIRRDGVPKGLAIISSIKTLQHSFLKKTNALATLGLGLGEQKCNDLLYLDVIFTKNETGMKYGSRLLQRIENDYPAHILCLFSVPKRGTMYFYHSRGFSYSDMSKSSPNLLPNILNKIDKAIEAWNGGFPFMTLLHAETEIKRPKIGIISNNIDWKTREDVNIFFDTEGLNFLLPTYTNTINDAKEYILRNRTCQRIIILTPLFRMEKQDYHNVTKKLLTCAYEIMKEDASIHDITVVCDNNEDRQIILKNVAAEVWGESMDEDIMLNPYIELPTPEKGQFINQPYTPVKKISDPHRSPPPLRYKK